TPVAYGLWWLLQFLLCGSMVTGNLLRGEEQLEALLETETQLIDELRDYIERLELQLEEIRLETGTIKEIHQQVEADGVEEFMGNPLNVLTLFKRFDSVWPKLEQQANATQKLRSDEDFFDRDVLLPTEEDYEESLNHLLHLQAVYELEPASLSLGMANGMKLGSAMSWGDCLEVARNSESSVARFWLESALNRLPSPTENATENAKENATANWENGRKQILEAQLTMEYHSGDLFRALTAAEELLLLYPTNPSVLKAKAMIEKRLAAKDLPKDRNQKSKPKPKEQKTKSVEQLLIEELCRGTTHGVTTGSRFSQCHLERGTPWTLLQPARLEPLSSDPPIVLYHNVLTRKQTDQLLELTDEPEEEEVPTKRRLGYQPLQLSKLAQKKLRSIQHHLGNEKDVHREITWQGRRQGHEHTIASSRPEEYPEHAARVVLNLQESGMGGALVFPQLELGVNIPRGSLLYWQTRTSESEMDYRSRLAVCPVLLGIQ
ncbi:hypothetical protein KR018_006069, partial [Drosophila ironensis]